MAVNSAIPLDWFRHKIEAFFGFDLAGLLDAE